ncbi:hypothetical protein HHK36_011041 [Tetracentron sinense]|uniref:PUM-HD domain-containing protein n=1 Tax=Tetracentron sinense TaxID=13715 RepID=A0A835DFV5_TETSI|nr:hypothetical protein HHK36_011041 [Tetracentron sinense]
MLSDMGMRSMVVTNDGSYGDDLGELNLCRIGSAPPTVEGSLNAVGGILGHSGNATGSDFLGSQNGNAFMAEEELRSDPAYHSYYYSNVNLNPRLPPPLLSKEDWRFAQRFQGGNSVLGGIGDRTKVNVADNGGYRSLFSLQPGFNSQKDECEAESRKPLASAEWGGDGQIGLSGLGLGSRQKSLAHIFQDDLVHATPFSGHPSRPASRNAFDDRVETLGSAEAQFSHLHSELASVDALQSGANIKGITTVQNIGASASHTYASALGTSLSRSTTPDPQLIIRAPSPCLPPVGGRRVGATDKRSINNPNLYNGVSSSMSESADLVAALSGMSLSMNSVVDEDNHLQSQIQHEVDDHQNFLFNLQGGQSHIKQHSYLMKSESGHLHLPSVPQSVEGSYINWVKSNGAGFVLNNPSLIDDGQVELHKPAVSSANSYLKGPSTPTFNNSRGLPSHYQNVDSTNSSFSNYGLSGYSFNPMLPSIMASHLGTSNLLPLFENAAAASVMAASAMEPRALRGLPSEPKLMVAELQNPSRMGNPAAGNALQVPLMDPLYLQYLRTAEYAAAQVAALNDLPVDRNYVGNSYGDLFGLQKAYLGALLSPQKSQYGVPFFGKSGGLPNGYHGNPAFGLGMSYPGSPLASPILPNSPVGSGSPIRYNDQDMLFSSGMRNITGGVMGSWNLEAGGGMGESFASSLLEEFKRNKTRCFELLEIAGHVVEFSADQYGSRFIQQKLETATTEEKNMVFQEIVPQALSLMTDVFGNYVIQKFFEHGTASQRRELANHLTGHVLTLSLQMYGCRVIQKAIEVVDLDQQTEMVAELDGHVMRCVRDQNGNHVIQKCIECIPQDATEFIISSFYDQVVTLSTHPYGCRVIQRVLEHCSDPKTQRIMMDEILQSVCILAQDQYGNYVVQHILEHGKPLERSAIIKELAGQIVQMSQQKFASNVVEKCLTFSGPAERQILVNEMLGSTDENEPLQAMMKDQFANYVVQKVLETCDDQQRELLLSRIKVHLNALKKYTYGKHIVARVEKLVAAGEFQVYRGKQLMKSRKVTFVR